MPIRHRTFGRMFIGIAAVVVLLVATTVAHAWTRYRYLSGYTCNGCTFTGSTSGFLDREYNSAYFFCCYWRVRYYDTNYNITWQNDSFTSPTSIGQTTGPRLAWCSMLDPDPYYPTAFNCDTTVP